MTDVLFTPVQLGAVAAPNRLVFTACSRHRARLDEVPTELMATYYAQRASAGLLISEGIAPSADGRGFAYTPGLFTDDQERGWLPVTDAVHRAGGRIFAQLMHVGRMTRSVMMPDGTSPISASAVAPAVDFRGYALTAPVPRGVYEVPRAMTRADVNRVVEGFASATRRAEGAGFDGVELHAGSGYLPMQFLCSHTNRRDDELGGGIDGRVRFVTMLMEAMAAVAGPERVGIKLSPGFRFNDVHDDAPVELLQHLLETLDGQDYAYVQISDFGDYYGYDDAPDWLAVARAAWSGPLIANGGLTGASARAVLESGAADAAGFGSSFIANPDLPARLAAGVELNVPDAQTFYTQGPEGYTDYPTLEQGAAPVGAPTAYDIRDVNRVGVE
jgi:N-ethylmaleimide reductase